MPRASLVRSLRRPSLPFILFCVFLVVLWIAGGAARSDVLGQAAVRLVATLALVVMLLFGQLPEIGRARPVWWLLGAAIALAAIQLIPLPPGLWQALPGRQMFAAATAGQPPVWRPLAIVPGAAFNALAALIVPLATLVMASGVRQEERALLPGAVLVMIVASNLFGLMQLSGSGFNNPFINESVGEMSGSFANRNHYALFLALGCLLVPVWVFAGRHRSRRRATAGVGLVLLFLLTILVSGSRAGLLLGGLALLASLLAARESIGRELRRAPRWAVPALIGAVLLLVAGFILLSIAADRAEAIRRIIEIDPGQDMRSRAFPTVWGMLREYFPFGAGLGGFDPIFRMHEPMALLKLTYFNHAHNDLVEVVLDAGVPGLLLLLVAFGWATRAGIHAWRDCTGANPMLPRVGAAILLLIALASVFDYPARTPTMMMIIVMAALWLQGDGRPQSGRALPRTA